MDKEVFFKGDIRMGYYLSRPNRFVVIFDLEGIETGASLPNPGKLGELFLPGASLYVQKTGDQFKYSWRVIAVVSTRGEIVMLDTHRNNRVARYLIDSSSIPSLSGYKVKRSEIPMGQSRFDFLLEDDKGNELYCEVKSCTLFGGSLAMFPDAVTARGKRHVEELTEMARQGIRTAVLFIIQSSQIEYFCPDYHTDPGFSRSLYESRDKILVIPVTAGWDDELNLAGDHREVPVLWNMYVQEGLPDRGNFLMLFYLDSPRGENYEKGYYLYISSENDELTRKMEKYKRPVNKIRNRRDWFRQNGRLKASWTVRTGNPDYIQCCNSFKLNGSDEAEWGEGYGILYFHDDPRRLREFQMRLITERMIRPFSHFKNITSTYGAK